MGSYHGTCAVTNLPIEEGEPVVGFLLAKAHGPNTEDYNGYVHPGEIWQTISLSFEGAYDGYGGIAVADANVADQLVGPLLGKSVADVIEAGSQEGTTIDLGTVGGMSGVRMMMVHKGIWDMLSSKSEYLGRTINYDEDRKAHLELLELWAEHSADGRPSTLANDADLTFFSREIDYVWGEKHGAKGRPVPRVWRMFGVNSETSFQPVISPVLTRLLGSLWLAGDRDGAVALLDHCLRNVLFDEQMAALRRLWIPQSGLGSTDFSAEIYSEVAEWTVQHASTMGLYLEDNIEEEGPGLNVVNQILSYGPQDHGSDFLNAISKIRLDRHDVLGMIHLAEQGLVGLDEGDAARPVLKRVVAWKRSSPAYDRHDAIGILRICADFKAQFEPAAGMKP